MRHSINAHGYVFFAADDVEVAHVWVTGQRRVAGCDGVVVALNILDRVVHVHNSLIENSMYINLTGTDEAILEHNYFKHGWGTPSSHGDYFRLGFGAATANKVFRYNTFDDVLNDSYTGLFVCTGSYTTYPSAYCRDIQVYGNVFLNIDGGGNGVFTTSNSSPAGTLPCSGWRVYNNTFYNSASKPKFFHNASDNEFKNNIVHGGNADIAGFTHEHNLYHSSCSNIPVLGTGELTSSQNVTELFVDASSGDFHLGASSEAIDAGIDLGALYATDPDGDPRGDDGAWDMGAYEH